MDNPLLLSPVKQTLLEQRLKGASRGPVKPPERIPVRPDRNSAPLSFTQRQMWLIDQLAPGNPAYNLPYALRLHGRLEITALEESFNEVIKRHEILRTTFAAPGGEPLQLIHSELKIKLQLTSLDHLTGQERENKLQSLASQESVKSFDLSFLPLIRASLFKLDDFNYVLIINLHHIVADGLSIAVLLNELDTFYRRFTQGVDIGPPPLTVQYGDFALWQRNMLSNEAAYARQIEFWRKQLGGRLSVLELPADKPRPAFQSFKGSNIFFNIPSAQVWDLKCLAAREGATFFMTILAGFQVLLHRYTGAMDMVIGTPVAARSSEEFDPLIGVFLNMAPLRCDLSGGPSFKEVLRRSRATTLNSFSNADLPLEVMMKHLNFERDPRRNPIFQVALQVLPIATKTLGDLEVSSFCFDLKFAQFDLTLHLYEQTGAYQGRFEYCTDLFDRESIERLSQNFLQLLCSVTRDPDQPISMLPLLADTERHQVQREEDEAFFQKLLGDLDEPTAPFGLVNVQGDGSRITEARRSVEVKLARRLRERARVLGVSTASLCHLAWALVLARASGRDDVVFGTVLFGRRQGAEDADHVRRPLINTLPVRIRIGDESVRESVQHTDSLLGQLLRHKQASLALAQRCSAVAPPAPLFSAILNYCHTAAQSPADTLRDWVGIEFPDGAERTNYPLMLSVHDLGEAFGLSAHVQSPLDPQRICSFMHTALEHLVTALENEPLTAVRSLDVLPESERRQLVEWNSGGPLNPASALCLHQLIEEQTCRTPDQIAVVHEDQTLTYRELNGRANQLARCLRNMGVGPDVLVGLFLERSLNMLVGILGILKAGGAYVPVDPKYPGKRVAAILEDAKPCVVLTQRSLINELPGPSICLDAALPEIAGQSKENLPTPVQPEHLAYVLFTSGSTGRPKGVALEHHSAVTFVEWARQVFTPEELAGVLLSTSICFDLSVFEIFVTLSAGGKIILAQNALDLPMLPEKDHVTLINTVPSVIAELLRMGAIPPSIKTINLAGEPLSDTLVEKIYASTATAKVYNLYGPTETTTYSTYTLVRRGGPVTIGRPITGTECYILDPRGSLAPIGVIGELYIAGAGLARAYYGRADLTEQRFVPNPFNGPRMYRTGDLCRWLPDGSIQYLGRADHQVKLRGFRIELAEIEAGIAQHPAVREVAVLTREDTPDEKRLVAYVATEKPPADLVNQFRARLRATLPEYMVPAQFVLLKALPRTPNGKLDRKALPAPSLGGASARNGAVRPQTATEAMVLDVFRSVLARADFGVSDNFFDLGGHSLMAARLMSGLRTVSGVDLPLRDLFARPTVSALAEAIDTRKWLQNSNEPANDSAIREEIVL